MDARFYNSEEIDIERLAADLVNAYKIQGFQAQQVGSKDQMLVQLKKGGDFEAIIGMQAALSLTIQRTSGGVLAMIGQQKWLDKAAVGAVGIVLPILWPLAVTAGVGAIRQASLGNQVLNMVDGLVRQQHPNVQVGPAPQHLHQQWGPTPYGPGQQPPYAPTPAYMPPQPPPMGMSPMPPMPPPSRSGLRCVHCNTPFEPGDTFCTGCGRSLAPPKRYCSNCNFEVKTGVSFCPKCGASTFQSQSAAGPVSPVQQAPTPPVSPAPAPTPIYTPPAQPPPPAYTPPPKPQTPIYIPSSQQTPLPTSPTIEYNAPTVQAQPTPPPKQEELYYAPPVTQDPAVAPQPHVTIVPSAAKQQQPATPQPKKETVYYVPSSQAQTESQPAANPLAPTLPVQPAQPTPPAQADQSPVAETAYYTPPAQAEPSAQQPKPRVQQPAHAPAAPKPIKAKPAVRPSFDPSVSWGTLTFSNGIEVQLSGERAVAGRSDHDLGGIEPEIDLAKMEGADTVSRIHAVIEHIGSSYTLTDLNSTNATRINGKRLDPDKATPFDDGDTLSFGKVTCTFKKV